VAALALVAPLGVLGWAAAAHAIEQKDRAFSGGALARPLFGD
jgi:hypothetical protein